MSTLEHLAEMDRLLRDLQAELAPEREPPAALDLGEPAPPQAAVPPPPALDPREPGPPPPPAPAPPPPAPVAPEPLLEALTDLVTTLVTAMRELSATYERALGQTRGPPRPLAAPTRAPNLMVSAGPFAGVEALREFEQAVSRLPGVQGVAVHGYEGADRAVLDVRLDPRAPSGRPDHSST